MPTDIRPLPGPVTATNSWQMNAACRGIESDVFFSPGEEPARDRYRRVRAAKAFCTACPVIAQCLDQALRTREPYGIWGGRSESERAKLLGLRSLLYPAKRTKSKSAQDLPATKGSAPRGLYWLPT